uniref:Leucine-rich repeat-containing N-terminal plant-type domain-containing protein n=1 Tax=Salix viminalis TaxID=40686 RepID=A0A6N2M049_SALVM
MGNNLKGVIPHCIGRLKRLEIFSFGANNLSEPKNQILDKSNVRDDDLSFLYPLENNTVLEIFEVADNHLGGVLPEILDNFSKNLRMVGFGRNQIRGTIPDGIGNLIGLVALGSESNQLSNMIPSSIGKLQNLGYLYLDQNKISGSIPSSVGNKTSLIAAHLELNNLHGSIPSNLGNC